MPRTKVSASKKKYFQQVRRWWVKIKNIEVFAQYEALKPFVQIIIGGDMQREYIKITKSEKFTRVTGEAGMTFKSDVLNKIVKGEKGSFKCELEAEVRMSYAQIEQEIFHVELWDFQGCSLNILKGYSGVPLLDIVRGEMDISFDIKTKVDKVMTQYGKIHMNCLFQEVWDFYITMRDWRSTELVPSKKKKKEMLKQKQLDKDKDQEEEIIDADEDDDDDEEDKEPEDLDDWMLEDPSIRSMLTYTLNSTKAKLYTKEIDGKEPYWSTIDGGMHFRGTVSDINQQILSLDLYNYAHKKTPIGRKTVSLSYMFEVIVEVCLTITF